MPTWRDSLEATYLRLDRRVLGVFRAGLGSVLLYDLARRFPDAGLLWSSDGVLGSFALDRTPQSTPQVSFLLGLSSASSVKLAFAGLGIVFLLYGLGLGTRVMQALALAGYASLNARNLFFEDGGTSLVILLLGWTLFLPLGDRFSLDTLVRDAARHRLKERVLGRARAKRPVISLALLAILLQAAVIYWLNAAHKTGQTWRADAVHLVLWQHRVNTPFALWFSAHEPTWFSPLASWLTKRTELVLPLLLLWPLHPVPSRCIAFVLAVLLHGGIALCLTLGPFSYAMICLVWLAIPGAALDAVARLGSPRSFWRLARYRVRAVRALRRGFFPSGASPRQTSPLGRRRLLVLREVGLGCMLVIEGANVLASNRAVPKALRLREPAWLLGYKPYLRGYQGWSMFAPEAPREDGTMVVAAITPGGRAIDPFTGAVPDFEQIRVGLAPHSIALSDYFFAMRDPRNARYRRELARYLKAYRTSDAGEWLQVAEVWWVSYVPPPRGTYAAGPVAKKRLWRVKL